MYRHLHETKISTTFHITEDTLSNVPHYKCNKPTRTDDILATSFRPALATSSQLVPVLTTVPVIITRRNSDILVQHTLRLHNWSSANNSDSNLSTHTQGKLDHKDTTQYWILTAPYQPTLPWNRWPQEQSRLTHIEKAVKNTTIFVIYKCVSVYKNV